MPSNYPSIEFLGLEKHTIGVVCYRQAEFVLTNEMRYKTIKSE